MDETTFLVALLDPDLSSATISPDEISSGVDNDWNGSATTLFAGDASSKAPKPTIVDIRSEKLTIMKEAMDKSKKIKIQYAAKYAGTSNYWKYYIGQTKGLKRMRVYEKKRAIEDNFRVWVASGDDKRQAKYGDALNLMKITD